VSVRKRKPTPLQLAALAKAREALIKKHTCERCGDEDPSRGLQPDSQDRIYTVRRDGVEHRYCISCKIYFRWLEKRLEIERQLVDLFTQKQPFWLLDFETTEKLEAPHCQIVEVAIIDQDGRQIFHRLCRPDTPMPERISEIHGITDELLLNEPTFPQIWPELEALLTSNSLPLYTWNADFDRAVLLKTARRFQLQVPAQVQDKQRWQCAMKQHAAWYGEWSNGRNTYRWQTLGWACEELGIETPEAHRALADAFNALNVMRAIAEQAGKYPPPEEMPSNQRFYGEW
jgi:DNA polymerase-3 subunit epsilon